jgi:DNA-binding beta-propeller fold protein YncE
MYDIGPLGLAFLDKDHLVVGDGSRVDGQELLRIYKVSAEAPSKPASEDSAVQTLGPITAEEGVTVKGEGNFYGVAVGADAIFVTCNGDDTKGWIAKVELKEGQPDGKLTPSISTKVAIEEHDGTVCDAPVAIAFSPDGKSLVVGQMGEMTVPGDSLLTFYNPDDGKLTKSYKTGLSDIAGLAYSPKTGKLYATDFSWHDTSQGGLFELAIDGDEVKATKIIGLDKPAAIAFDEQGNLYLTEFGTAQEDDTKLPGTLSMIKAGL